MIEINCIKCVMFLRSLDVHGKSKFRKRLKDKVNEAKIIETKVKI